MLPATNQLFPMIYKQVLRHALLLSCLFCLVFDATAQSSPQAVMTEVVNRLRANDFRLVDERPLYEPGSQSLSLQLVTTLYEDTLQVVRSRGYYLTRKIGLSASNPDIRQQAVRQLLSGLDDPEAAVVGHVMTGLSAFRRMDYDDAARAIVAGYLGTSLPYYDRLLRLAGFLNLQEQATLIRQKLADGSFSKTERWAARLALARLGDETVLSAMLDKLDQVPVSEDLIYEVGPDLIYTRQKAAFDFLVSLLQSEEANCLSADPDATQKIACGYRVMELFPGVVQDFPLEAGPSGDLITDNYREALLTARTWFEERGDEYTIIDVTY